MSTHDNNLITTSGSIAGSPLTATNGLPHRPLIQGAQSFGTIYTRIPSLAKLRLRLTIISGGVARSALAAIGGLP